MDIMNAGGGIHATTRMTREATEDELIEQTKRRLDSFLNMVSRLLKAKVDMVDLETELKQLRVMKRLQENIQSISFQHLWEHMQFRLTIKVNEDEFIDLIINEMLQ